MTRNITKASRKRIANEQRGMREAHSELKKQGIDTPLNTPTMLSANNENGAPELGAPGNMTRRARDKAKRRPAPRTSIAPKPFGMTLPNRKSKVAGAAMVTPPSADSATDAPAATDIRAENKSGSGSATRKPVTTAKTTNTPFFYGGTLKAEQGIRLPNGRKVAIGGLRTPDGDLYVWVRSGRRFATMPLAFWHAGSGDGSRALREQGVYVVGGLGELREAVALLKRFPPLPIVTRPGWSRFGFAQANGQVLVKDGEAEPLKTFAPIAAMLDQGGSLEGWKEHVAGPLADHQLASFVMMIAFAGPLLRLTDRADNYGFEVAGPAGRGKSKLQMLMASAAGRAVGGEGETYWRTCNATVNALEKVM